MNRDIVGAVFPSAIQNIDKGLCATGNHPVGEFRDELSRKEFGISGMCQNCQDEVFGV